MTQSRLLFEHFPLYARLADERGILQHICKAIQPELNAVYKILAQREEFYNLDSPVFPPDYFLDWLGQLVGLGAIDDRYLGIGLKATWPSDHKRTVIRRAWKHWQRRGTEAGIREAIALWLLWPGQDTTRYQIQIPFGDRSTANPPAWWDYETIYNTQLNQLFAERQHFGSGDYSQPYDPDWFSLEQSTWLWDYSEIWWNQELLLDYKQIPTIDSEGSGLGPQNVAQHFQLRSDDWNRIFPDVYELNWEMWAAHLSVATWGWLSDRNRFDRDRSLSPSRQVILKAEENLEESRYLTIDNILPEGYLWGDLCNPYGGDLWPMNARPASVEIEWIESTEEWGVWKGAQYTDYWGGIGRKLPTSEVLSARQVYTEGTWPGCLWGDVYKTTSSLSNKLKTRTEIQFFEGIWPGLQWSDEWFSAIALNPNAVSEEEILTEGIWPGLQWSDEWFASIHPDLGERVFTEIVAEGIWPGLQWSDEWFSGTDFDAREGIIYLGSSAYYFATEILTISSYSGGSDIPVLTGGSGFYGSSYTKIVNVVNPTEPLQVKVGSSSFYLAPYYEAVEVPIEAIDLADNPAIPGFEPLDVIPGIWPGLQWSDEWFSARILNPEGDITLIGCGLFYVPAKEDISPGEQDFGATSGDWFPAVFRESFFLFDIFDGNLGDSFEWTSWHPEENGRLLWQTIVERFPQEQSIQYASYSWDAGIWWFFAPGEIIEEEERDPFLIGPNIFYNPSREDIEFYLDPDTSLYTDPYPGTWWYVPTQEIVTFAPVEVIIPEVPCYEGLIADIEIGRELQIIDAKVAQPGNQFVQILPETSELIQISGSEGIWPGFAWGDYWPFYYLANEENGVKLIYIETIDPGILPFVVSDYQSPEISFETILVEGSWPGLQWSDEWFSAKIRETIHSTVLIGSNLFYGKSYYEVRQVIHELPDEDIPQSQEWMSWQWSDDWFTELRLFYAAPFVQKIGIPLENSGQIPDSDRFGFGLNSFYLAETQGSTKIVTTPARIALTDPLGVFTHYDLFGEGWQWYWLGQAAIAGHIAEIPIIDDIHLCNIRAPWSTGFIEEWVKERQLLNEESESFLEIYPVLKKALVAQNWKLLIELNEGIVVLDPVTQFWTQSNTDAGLAGERSQQFSLSQGRTNLYLEFVSEPAQDSQIRSISLFLDHEVIFWETPFEPLNYQRPGFFGFSFLIKPNFVNSEASGLCLSNYVDLITIDKTQKEDCGCGN